MVINPVKTGGPAGQIGVSACPGKSGDLLSPAARRHLLERDIQTVKEWRAHALVSALEDEELKIFGVEDVGATATRAGIWWFRVPLKQQTSPDNRFWNAWPHTAPALLDILRRGQRVVVHSSDQHGRAGLVTCCLLVELGVQPVAALAALRNALGDPTVSPAQELFVREYLPRFSEHTRLRST